MCATVYGWRHLVKATEVTAGLAKSNGSLPLPVDGAVTCRLTACTPGSAPGPTLGNEYGRTISNHSCLFWNPLIVSIGKHEWLKKPINPLSWVLRCSKHCPGNNWDSTGGRCVRHDLRLVLRSTSDHHQCHRTSTCLRVDSLRNVQVSLRHVPVRRVFRFFFVLSGNAIQTVNACSPIDVQSHAPVAVVQHRSLATFDRDFCS